MKLYVDKNLWEDYYIYEPCYPEFEFADGLNPDDFIDLKKYHYRFCSMINSSTKKELVEQGFTSESAQQLKKELKWAKSYPVYEVFEEPADFWLDNADDQWQWEKRNDTLCIFSIQRGQLVEFIIEDIDEEDGSSNDFEELGVIIETEDGSVINDGITINDFEEGTRVIGFNSALESRYFFSKENAVFELENAKSTLGALIPMIKFKNKTVNSLEELIEFIDESE